MQPAIDAILQKHDLEFCAAEAHGIASGMLCLAPNTDGRHWLDAILDDEVQLSDDDQTPLLALFARTQALLDPQQGGFDFDLLLPDDDEPFNERIQALAAWCQGFLFGVGYSHSSVEWPGDCQEILRDLVELTKLDADEEDDSEDNAFALSEIHEYVRAAVLTIRDHFLDAPSATQH